MYYLRQLRLTSGPAYPQLAKPGSELHLFHTSCSYIIPSSEPETCGQHYQCSIRTLQRLRGFGDTSPNLKTALACNAQAACGRERG